MTEPLSDGYPPLRSKAPLGKRPQVRPVSSPNHIRLSAMDLTMLQRLKA